MRYSGSRGISEKSKRYSKFKGADFSTDPTQVDDSRSPWPLNLIADEGGFPEKRPGWRVMQSFSGRINGIFTLTVNDVVYWIVHHGTTISRWDGDTVTGLKTGVNNSRSQGFVFGGKLYLLTGAQYLVVSVSGSTLTCANVSDSAYVPRTVIARAPSGGGTTFEGVNLISPKRQNDFLADGTAKVYQLDADNIGSVVSVEVNGTSMTSGYTVDAGAGTVTFSTAPKKPEDAGGVAGADNVKIVYSKAVSGYAARITGCTVCTQFGRGTVDRVFFSGNPAYQNQDWCSGYNDPTYIPDVSYSVIGSEETAIMGYLHIGEYLAIIKEDNQQDSTIFIRSAEVDADSGEVKFPVRQGVQSIGAVSKYCFASLRDDPLFLSRYGVNAVTTNNVTLERTIKRRSGLVDPRLTGESNLGEAVGCVWGDWYVISVNSHCYVADSKQQSWKNSVADNYMYEWYYWENIPARVLREHDGMLYFGDSNGKLCVFNSDRDGMNRFSDNGAAITAEWATKADDDGDFMRYKTLTRRGAGVMCKPYTNSSVKILIRTDRDFGVQIRSSSLSIFDFEELDFSNFSFNTSDTPQIVAFNRKIRKYKTMQIIVRNDGVNQGFGVFGIIKRFKMMNYVKR